MAARRSKRKAAKAAATGGGLPSEDDILKFLADAPGTPGKREIARAFHIRGADRIPLKKLLKSMSDRGLINRRGKRLHMPGTLPPVAVLVVTGTDIDGELTARPEQWDDAAEGPPPAIVVLTTKAGGARADLQPPSDGDRILAKLNRAAGDGYAYEARVIRRLSVPDTRILGVFRRKANEAWVVPVDKRARDEWSVAPGNDGGAQPDELVEVKLIRDRGRGLKGARVVNRLGSVADQRNISLIAAQQHSIKLSFDADTLASADGLEIYRHQKRRDMRMVPLITIDPADARDHDDAVWAEPDTDPDNPGGFKAIVAIADVAHYVRPAGALDREARTRGNSTYFPDRVVPMLPERISNDLCSLREAEDRPALACFMTFSKTGVKRTHHFERITMRSAAGLSYEQAQAAIDGRPDDRAGPLLKPVLKPLWATYAALTAARRKRGPLELNLPERKLILAEDGHIERIHTPERLDAHKLIEEFMIQANVAAAETLEQQTMVFPYRVHEAPSASKLEGLSEFLSSIGLSSPKGQVMKPKHFNDLLKRVEGKDHQQIVHDVVLRSQSQAVYSPANQGHFGLNLRRYAHFTSPIRRYADLLVHRALISACKLGDGGLSDGDVEKMEATCELISQAERRSMLAERDTADRLVAAFLADRVRTRFWARVSGVTRAGLFVRLDDSGADGFVPAASLDGDYFVHEDHRHALVGAQTGETYQLADRVEVRLLEVTPVAGGLRFEMLSSGKPGKPPARRKTGPRRPMRRARRR